MKASFDLDLILTKSFKTKHKSYVKRIFDTDRVKYKKKVIP